MFLKEILVPNIGDFKDVEVIEVLVSNGQDINKNDPLITIESDKSSVEVPSTENGKVKFVKVKVGDKVSEGDIIVTLETEIKKENNKPAQKHLKKEDISIKVEKKKRNSSKRNKLYSTE